MRLCARISVLSKFLVSATLLLAAAAQAQTAWTVNTFTDTSFATLETGGGFGPGVGSGNAGDLRYVLFQAMATGGANTITFPGCSVTSPCTIVLGAPLPPIFETSNISSFSLTIDGGAAGAVVIDGNSLGTNTTSGASMTNRVFFVDNVAVTLKNLVIQNATAKGGAGGNGSSRESFGGGGGAGFGAGLLVNQSTAAVVVQGTSFLNCATVGGTGGAQATGGYGDGGGGGGLGFAGGFGNNAGGGGGGVSAAGQDANGYAGANGGAGGGGGGAGNGYSGGTGGTGYASNSVGGTGANDGGGGGGGFGGGGGGGEDQGGAGGFGAGGGGAFVGGGYGGSTLFGGGGGGGQNGFPFGGGPGSGGPTVGGVAGGSGGSTTGGGGAAAGPAIFVVNGSVTLYNTTGSGFTATAGAAGGSGDGSTAGTSSNVPVFNYGGTVNGSTSVGPIYNAFTVTEPVGTTSAMQTATLTFTTAVTASNSFTTNVLTQGAANLDFAFVSGGTCTSGTAYAVGATCTVEYSFTPTHPGNRYGGITLTSASAVTTANPTGTVASVYISGVGTGPQMVFPTNTSVATLGGNFGQTSDVSVDASGNVYVVDNGKAQIDEIPVGCSAATCVNTLGGNFYYPISAKVDGLGNVFVSDIENTTFKEIPAGCTNASCVISVVQNNYDSGHGIAVDGMGNVYIAYGANGVQVVKIPQGCLTNSCLTLLGGGFNFPSGLAVDGSGNVYVADYGNKAVKEIPPTCTSASCVISLGGNWNYPFSVAVDGSGTVYVGSYSSPLKSMPAGCTSASCVTSLGVSYEYPYGLALDGSGNLYVAGLTNDAVQEIALATPPTVAFATTTTDGTTDNTDGTQTVILANDGNEPLLFAIPGNGVTNPTTPNDFTFTITGTGACPSLTSSSSTQGTLAAGATCTVPITFTPVEPSNGGLTESLVFTDNALNVTNATQAITLSGTAMDPAPTITGISPNYGPIAGGTVVTITGTNFTGAQNVYFLQCAGNSTASFTVVNSTTITATSTADGLGSACTAQVSVLTPGGTSNSVNFNYYNATLTSLSVSGYSSPAILTEGSSVTVTALDQNGNVYTGFTGTVTLSSSDSRATLPAAYTFQSSDNGVHTFNVTLNTLGTQSITATSGGVSGSQTGILVGDAVWVLSHNGFLSKLNSQGGSSVAQIQTYDMSNGNSGGLAMDASGDIWETNNYVFGVARVNPAGSSSTEFSGGGITSPDAIAIDGAGYVWVANASGNNVSEFNNSGTAISGSNGYGSAYNLSAPSGVAIDLTGGVWVANKTGNSVTHVFGAAAPVVTPLSTATANGTLGSQP